MKKLISVIIPCYNAEAYLSKAVASVILQMQMRASGSAYGPKISNYSYGPQAEPEARCQNQVQFEIIIIDDGSTDNTVRIAKELAANDKRIKYFYQENQGQSAARSYGVKHCVGDYVVFLDSDDELLPDSLVRLVEALNKDKAAVMSYGSHIYINEHGTVVGNKQRANLVATPTGDVLKEILRCCFLIPGTACIRADILCKTNIVSNVKQGEDWIMWCRLAAKGNFIFVPGKPILKHRMHSSNITSTMIDTPQAYFAAVDIVYNDENIVGKLDKNLVAKLKQRKISAINSFLARKFLVKGDFDRAKEFMWQSLKIYPFSLYRVIIYIMLLFGFVPKFLLRRFGSEV